MEAKLVRKSPKLKELIAEYCPDGVEYFELEKVITSLKTGLNPRKNFQLNTPDANNYYVTVRELSGNKVRFFDKTDKVNDSALKLINNRSNLEINDILFSGTGTVGRTAIVESEPKNWDIKEGVYVIKPKLELIQPKFLLYILNSSSIVKKYEKSIVGSPVISLPMGDLRKQLIPVPPLPIQEEIVRMLDTFTELKTELEEKLEAELDARILQYEYYRDNLLDFNSDISRPPRLTHLLQTLCPDGVEYKSLNQISHKMYRGAGIKRDQLTESGTPCVRYGEIYTTYGLFFDKCVSFTDSNTITSKKYFSYGDILFAITGEKIEEISKSTAYLGNDTCLVGGDIVVMKHNENPKYISYVLSTREAQIQKSSGKIKSKVVHSSVPELGKIRVPVPPLPIQDEIVAILDRFEALVTDLKDGLPAEIAARRKQYEYYRNQLLTFPPLN